MPTNGKILEARYHRIMICKGFCTFRNVIIQTSNNEKIATDIDLLAYKYNETLDKYLVNTECKSGNIEVFDRLFWLNGLSTFLRSNKSTLIVNKITDEYIDFAKILNIDIVSMNEIEDIEKSLNLEPAIWPGLSDYEIYDPCFSNIDTYGKIDGITNKTINLIKDINKNCRLFIWKGFNFNSFNRQIRLLNELVKENENAKNNEEQLTICQLFLSILLISLSHSLIYICHEVFLRPKTERLEYLKQKLIYGEQDIEYMKKYIISMNKIVNTIIRKNTEQSLFSDNAIDIGAALKEPDYCDSLCKLINVFLTKINQLISLPYAIEIRQFTHKEGNYSKTKISDGNQAFELMKAFLIQNFNIAKEYFNPPDVNILLKILNKRNITTV